MQQHWKIIVWLLLGVVVGTLFQIGLEGHGWLGARFDDHPSGVVVSSIETSLLPKGRESSETLRAGDVVTAVILNRGMGDKERAQQTTEASVLAAFL
ncbi:MAG TPA: hypothetical protein EYN79_07625, partial [Planctomycetes bacterium]|nr:hypothetical protein [Planctomycetota bacterium]